jgi:hypothetical protein
MSVPWSEKMAGLPDTCSTAEHSFETSKIDMSCNSMCMTEQPKIKNANGAEPHVVSSRKFSLSCQFFLKGFPQSRLEYTK